MMSGRPFGCWGGRSICPVLVRNGSRRLGSEERLLIYEGEGGKVGRERW